MGLRKRLKTLLSAACMVGGLVVVGHGQPPAFAADPVRVIMPLWGPTIQPDGSGLFVDLFKEMLRGEEDRYEISFVDYEDALQMVVYGGGGCAYPFAISSVLAALSVVSPDVLVESRPVLVSHTHVFSRPGDPVMHRLSDIRDKLLLQIRGEDYQHNETTRFSRFWNVDSELQKVKVLLSGRGDAMLGSMPEILFSFREAGLEMLPYDRGLTILRYNNSLTCRKSPETEALVSVFSARVEAALADGRLREEAVSLGIPASIIDDYLPAAQP